MLLFSTPGSTCAWRNSDLQVGLIVARPIDMPYDYQHIGVSGRGRSEAALIDGTHPFADVLKKGRTPDGYPGRCCNRASGRCCRTLPAAQLARDAMAGKDNAWNAFNILHTAAGRVGALDLDFLPPGNASQSPIGASELDTLLLLNCDSPAAVATSASTVVYLRCTHGDAGAHKADVILPGAAFTEKSATYVNMEGRAQVTSKAAFAPGDAREDWKIIRALSDKVQKTLAIRRSQCTARGHVSGAAPHLAQLGHVAPAGQSSSELADIAGQRGRVVWQPSSQPAIDDFYLSNPIARASAVMAELSALRRASAPTSARGRRIDNPHPDPVIVATKRIDRSQRAMWEQLNEIWWNVRLAGGDHCWPERPAAGRFAFHHCLSCS